MARRSRDGEVREAAGAGGEESEHRLGESAVERVEEEIAGHVGGARSCRLSEPIAPDPILHEGFRSEAVHRRERSHHAIIPRRGEAFAESDQPLRGVHEGGEVAPLQAFPERMPRVKTRLRGERPRARRLGQCIGGEGERAAGHLEGYRLGALPVEIGAPDAHPRRDRSARRQRREGHGERRGERHPAVKREQAAVMPENIDRAVEDGVDATLPVGLCGEPLERYAAQARDAE